MKPFLILQLRGDDKASEIAKNAYNNGTTLKEEALKLKYLSEEEFEGKSAQEITDTLYETISAHYKDKIETELKDICNDVLELLDQHLLLNSKNPEAIVFFLKMKGRIKRKLRNTKNIKQH